MKREPERALALPFSGELEGKNARAVARLIENSGEDASNLLSACLFVDFSEFESHALAYSFS